MARFVLEVVRKSVLCSLLLAAACGRPASPPPQQNEVKEQPRSETKREEPAPAAKPVDLAPFDLGGPCSGPGAYGPMALTGKREEELRANRQWDDLIDGLKKNIRNACAIPYRWQTLFATLVEADRYGEAVQVLAEVKGRGFPFPHAIVSQVDRGFLESEVFKNSSAGMEYWKREAEVQDIMQRAEQRLAAMSSKELPANPYRSAGACPFECCVYRDWKTRSAVQLRESIESAKIVAEVKAGVTVNALTGEVRVEPEPFAVLQDVGILHAGDVLFFLDNRGEGFVNYWYDGKLNPELGFDEGLHFFRTDSCQVNLVQGGDDPCWLKPLRPDKTFASDWWVQIRTREGKTGWVLNTRQFDNTDRCG